MPANQPWTWEETLKAFALFLTVPSGSHDKRNKKVIALAQDLGRTPSSVVLKLANIKANNPYNPGTGLKNSSKLDKRVWQEYLERGEDVVDEAMDLLERSFQQTSVQSANNHADGRLDFGSTDTASKMSQLDEMLSNFTNSYKLFWFKSIFIEAINGNTRLPLRSVAARMISLAWFGTTHYKLKLGSSDKIDAVVNCAIEACNLSPNSSESEVLNAVLSSSDPTLNHCLDSLCKYVPFRLIRPFYHNQLEEIREEEGFLSDSQFNRIIFQLNRKNPAGAPYRFSDDGKELEIEPDWVQFFISNQESVRNKIDARFFEYLKARNPKLDSWQLSQLFHTQ